MNVERIAVSHNRVRVQLERVDDVGVKVHIADTVDGGFRDCIISLSALAALVKAGQELISP